MTPRRGDHDGLAPRGLRAISVATVVVLVLGALGAYQLGKPKHARFRRGGAFVSARSRVHVEAATPLAVATDVPAANISGVPDFSAGAQATPASRSAPTSTTTTGPGTVAAAVSAPLALGTYTYALRGSESATGFGSRQYPAEMTLTAHTAPGVAKDQAVLDLFFSKDHQERDIVSYRDDSVAFAFEGGSITFGPVTQTSEADYVPAMTQIPLPLRAGDTRKGTTEAKGKNGSVTRVEDWTVRIVRQETLTIAGKATPTWVVTTDRKTRPGSSDQATRSRTYWYDPARRLWVKWAEKMHGERKTVGFTFTYDTAYEAMLTRFAPA